MGDSGQRCCNLCGDGIVVNGPLPLDGEPDLIKCLQCRATAPADTGPTPMAREKGDMSGTARTAWLTVTMELRVTDTAFEGEILDAVTTALRDAKPKMQHPAATYDVRGITTQITTESFGGHL